MGTPDGSGAFRANNCIWRLAVVGCAWLREGARQGGEPVVKDAIAVPRVARATPCVEVPPAAYEGAGPVPRNTPRPPGLHERVLLRRPPELPGVEHWRAEASTRLWTVYHQTYTFCVADRSDAEQSWLYRRQAYGMKIGVSTMLIEPGEVHVTTKVGLADFRVLQIDPAAIEREFADEPRRPGRHFRAGQTDDPAVARALLQLCHAIEDGDADAFERRAQLRRYLFAAFARAGEHPPRIEPATCERAVLRAQEVLRARFSESLNLDEIAAYAGASKYYLERCFRVRFGVPMHRYLKLLRLDHARRLLQRGLPAIDVAHETGFSDAAHMGRVFRAELGFTPGMYARAG